MKRKITSDVHWQHPFRYLDINQDSTSHHPLQLTQISVQGKELEKALSFSRNSDRIMTRTVKFMKVENDPYSPQGHFKLSKCIFKITSIDLYFQGQKTLVFKNSLKCVE